MSNQTYGYILMLIGVIYIIKPNIFRVGIWKKTAISQQVFSAKQYNIYMRVIGVVLIGIGIYLVFIK